MDEDREISHNLLNYFEGYLLTRMKISYIPVYNYNVDSQTLENMSDEGLSLSNSNATSEPNMPKNRYENVLPCKNNVKKIFHAKRINLPCIASYLASLQLNMKIIYRYACVQST